MSVLVNKDSKILVQGFTGTEGSFHATQMIEYGTNVVGGVTPNKGGTTHLEKPVFNTVADAVKNTGANVSIIFVPPAFAADAIMEAADAGIALVRCVRSSTEFSCTALPILPSQRQRCSSGPSSRWPGICFRFSTMWGDRNHVP